MTTPLTQVYAYTLSATSTGSGYMRRTDTSGDFVPLPPGLNTVTIAWMGDSALTFNYRNPAGLVTTLGAEVPASVTTRAPRQIILQIPVDTKSSGARIHVRALSATAWDVERVVCGVQVINQPKV